MVLREAFFQRVRVLSEAGVPDMKPDEGCFANILNLLAQSQEANISADQVLRIVKQMKDDLGTVTTASLNSTISICSKTVESQTDKRKALEAAFLIFQLGRDSASCDADTYGLMIRTCINLTEDENTRMKLIDVSSRVSISFISVHQLQPGNCAD